MKLISSPLWARLTLAGLLTQGLLLSMLVISHIRLSENELLDLTRSRIDNAIPLLNAALSTPLMQRDFSALHEILAEARAGGGFIYLVLLDRNEQRIAASGLDDSTPLPALDKDIRAIDGDHIFDQRIAVTLSGKTYGQLRFGVDMDFLTQARARVLRQGILIGLVAVLLTIVTLSLIGYLLTRRLKQLTDASHALADQNFDALLPASGPDEVGQLAAAFRTMTQQLGARMSELKASETQALDYLAGAESERSRLKALFSAMNLGILFIGVDRRVIYHNPGFNHIWQLAENDDLIGLNADAIFARSTGELAQPEEYLDHITQALSSLFDAGRFEFAMRDGRVITQSSYAVRDCDERFIGHLWVFEDITSERQTAEQLLFLAERDTLTGLYNRHRFQSELERMLAESGRHAAPSALLYFDLDEFKAINDHFGHRAGDALLIRVAGEVSGLTRRNEMLFRLGGDEFAVFMPGADRQQAEALAERIVRSIAQIPFRFESQPLRISSSLGIALHPEHAADQEQLVACADAAMYQAKQAGKNTWRAYRADLDTTPEMVKRLSWNERLAHALEHDLFELHYQGVYAIHDRKLAHLEALIRLRDEESGELVSPGLFIPVAEKSNKILEIDRWTLRRVVRLLAEQPAAPPIAVNLSGRSFDDPALPGFIADLLKEHRADPARLIIEITETAAVSDLTDAERFIEALKQTGCGVCLDDFGAGFASFAYLKHIRVDTIKLDGMFIRNLAHDHDNQVFVRGMVEVARGLGKVTVAECVENEATLNLLATLGVDKAQGFHLDRPQAHHPALRRPLPEGHHEPG